MAKRVAIFGLFVLFFSILVLGEATKTDQPYDSVEWELPFPGPVLDEPYARLFLTSGFHLTPEAEFPGGLFFLLEPSMRFLIFEGSFRFKVQAIMEPNNFFFDIENQRPGDYFSWVKLRIKNLFFSYGQNAGSHGKLVYLPVTPLDRKYIGFDWSSPFSDNPFRVHVRSDSWSAWAGSVQTPGWRTPSLQLSGVVDAYFDRSASITAAVSLGPQLGFFPAEDLVPLLTVRPVGEVRFFQGALDPESGEPASWKLGGGVRFGVALQPVEVSVLLMYREELEWSGTWRYAFPSHPQQPLVSFVVDIGQTNSLFPAFLGRLSFGQASFEAVSDDWKLGVGFGSWQAPSESSTYVFSDLLVRLQERSFFSLKSTWDGSWAFDLGIRFDFSLDGE